MKHMFSCHAGRAPTETYYMDVTLELLMVAQKYQQKPVPLGKHGYLSLVEMENLFLKFILKG